MNRYSTFHIILEAINETKECCCLCSLEDKALRAYLEPILYEAVNDPKVRAELVSTKGYCHRHAHFLTGLRDSLGIAILYQDQVNLFLESLAKLNPASKNKFEIGRKSSACPACQSQQEARERYIAIFLDALKKPEVRTAFESSAGLCRPHFLKVFEAAKDVTTKEYLLEVERQTLELLLQELQEFCRKHDYRYRDETYGKESDSWIRAINIITGGKENF